MSFEKAELILQTLLAGDRDFFLVRQQPDGRTRITDRPRVGDEVVEKMPKRPESELVLSQQS